MRGGAVRFAERTVLSGVDLVVGASERIAVIGDNGAGKSTLLGVIAGTVSLTAGERLVELPGGFALAEQRPDFPPDATVAGALDELLADVHRIESEIQETAERVAHAEVDEQPAFLDRLSAAMDRFEARDGYHLDQRVDAALDQLGLGGLDRARPVRSLSGGERARLALAAAMSSEAELLLLDEPTNDLDDAGIAWLEDRLSRHRGALVVVTHDRVFLDRFATALIRVEDGALRRYGDSYTGYLAAREAERRRLLEEHEEWRQELVRNEALIAANAFRLDSTPQKRERAIFGHAAFRARSRDHGAMRRIGMAKGRVARLRANPAPRPADPLRFLAPFTGDGPPEAGDDSGAGALLLAADAVRLGVDGRGPRLTLDSLEVRAGERWLISGPNGAGKTTLLRLLAGELTPHQGTVWRSPDIRAAWLRQDLATGSRKTLLDAFADAIDAYHDDAAQSLLRLGLFHPDDLARRLTEMSIGQRRRYEVAVAVTAPSDILLLDEPTNHLNPELVEQLEHALLDYPGAVLTVTHDRRWRERATTAGHLRRIHVLPGGDVSAMPSTG
ncbi:ABC-F family ATP-binding cassette domain-containing protein [Micromonospora sp. NBC_01796]|uniref:ABC-F family ATP-binding cassette domain-containing protein n=1 Tax=Micromonospora sp. NBC_01796 TaxID=2975987 RepID=UPI003FA363C9